MHPAVFVMVAAKAGVPLNFVFHLTRSCHDLLLSILKENARRKNPTGVVAISKKG
jgi:hypothetical protein